MSSAQAEVRNRECQGIVQTELFITVSDAESPPEKLTVTVSSTLAPQSPTGAKVPGPGGNATQYKAEVFRFVWGPVGHIVGGVYRYDVAVTVTVKDPQGLQTTQTYPARFTFFDCANG